MTYMRFFLSVCFILFMAKSALATPHLVVHVQDHPIAVSQNHLYVVRHMSDNMGFHNAERSKTYILKLDIKTSKIIEFHKLQESQDSEGEGNTQVSANKTFNMFEYFEQENAVQIGLLKEQAYHKVSVEKSPPETKPLYRLSRKVSRNVDNRYKEIKEISPLYEASLKTLIQASLKPILSDYIGPLPNPVPNKEIYHISLDFNSGPYGGICMIDKVLKAPEPLSKWRYGVSYDDYLLYMNCRSAEHTIYVDAVLPLSLTFRDES